MDHTSYDEEYPKENDIIELLPCLICNRSFRPTLLPRHSAICQKNAKKRKIPFDSSKQRIKGTEMAAFLPIMKKKQDPYAVVSKPKTNWRAKHEELIRAVKSARGEKVDDKCVLTKPVDSEACPYCMRNFGPKSYERHVEFCREKAQRRPSAPLVNPSARERLEARTKYRVPPIKSQRTVTKEKYSPKNKTSLRDVSSSGAKVIQPAKNVKKTTSSSTNGNLSNILRQSSSMFKNKDQISKSLYGNRNAINLPQKSVVMKKEPIMKKSESAYILGSRNQVKRETIQTITNHEKKNMSKSQPHLDSYDPFKSAERQMKELELDSVNIGIKNPLNCTPTENIDNLQISPMSAFVKYSPISMLTTPDNIENSFSDELHTETNLNNHPLHSLSNLSLCSVVSIESADFNNKTQNAVMRCTEPPKSPSKRNISINPKKYLAIENMLYGDNEKNKSNLKFDLAEQELLKSVSEFENLLKLTDDDDIVSPSFNRTSALSMMNGVNINSSADSAYGSLSRKSEQISSDNYQTHNMKTAKFCHECGFKYPIADVKFCTECGMRRISS